MQLENNKLREESEAAKFELTNKVNYFNDAFSSFKPFEVRRGFSTQLLPNEF